jgi:hypothetical protein
MSNILDTIKGQLGADTVNNLAKQLGENSAAVQKAIDSLLPNIMNGVSKQGASVSGWASSFDADGDGDVDLNDLSGMASKLSGGAMNMVNGIFGNKKEAIKAAVSEDAGISQESAGSLMDSLTSMVMSNVSKVQSSTGIDINSILGNLQKGSADLMGSGSKQLNSLLGGSLDADGDGDLGVDDIMQAGKNLFGRFMK